MVALASKSEVKTFDIFQKNVEKKFHRKYNFLSNELILIAEFSDLDTPSFNGDMDKKLINGACPKR